MKLSPIIFGIAAIIMIIGAFSKIMHYPQSSMIMMIAYLTAAAGFIAAIIRQNRTKIS